MNKEELAIPKELENVAKNIMQKAYSPYSGFKVGCAIMDDKDNIHDGCNVENASYPCGNCAEANAIGNMIRSGGKKIAIIAIVSSKGETTPPCGKCRQIMAEFATEKTRVWLLSKNGNQCYTMNDLLPLTFSLKK